MAVLEVNWNPSRRELRQFGVLWLVFFAGMAAWLYFRHGPGLWPTVLGTGAVAVGLPGIAFPALLKPIYVGWMIAAFPIGWTVSHLLLGSIFYLVISPIGLLLRLFGHDPMKRKFDRSAKSYWIEHERADTARYFRMY
jgi:hypothetical protein